MTPQPAASPARSNTRRTRLCSALSAAQVASVAQRVAAPLVGAPEAEIPQPVVVLGYAVVAVVGAAR